MKFGYARVSTKDQNLDMQLMSLTEAGCTKLFKEKQGAVKERPELVRLLDQLREGDTLVVWKLDRLGRSLRELIDLVAGLNEKGVQFVSLQDNIDTTTSHGKLIFNIFASFAEFERDLIRERTMAGLAAARSKGRVGGKPKGLTDEKKKTAYAAWHLTQEGKLKVSEIYKTLNISKATYYRYISFVSDNNKLRPNV